ncbi:MAG: S46 family peptidase [Rikenellaceae bacterium]|jgi:hypothetical protein|nr:S46 family peptidase [Rikenellaceae bacterium]
MKRLFTTLIITLLTLPAVAEEGMWLPAQIEGQVRQMRKMGFRLKADDLYSAEKAAFNDAIVLFGSGCTGAIVSDEGLLLTNHHCGYSQIQRHSTVAHDYLTRGFWAMNKSEELPNPGLEVRIMVRMEDVTSEVLAGRRDEVIKTAGEGGRYEVEIKSLYYENQYFMWVYEVFSDVRLVAAPPSAIGKFGGDTDNWMWPRHTGDFSVFRIYAGADNRPASYSPDNVPYRPARHFAVSTKGVSEGDFTFVYGFPGTTQQYITSDAVAYILERADPMKISLRTQRLDIIRAASDADPAVRIKYASKQASIANGWKKWQGEVRGLARLGTVAKKEAQEAEFRRWAASRPEYAHLLDSMEASYAEWQAEYFRQELFRETFGAIELSRPLNIALSVKNGALTDQQRQAAETFYKDYEAGIDRPTTAQMLRGYAEMSDRVPTCLTHLVDSLGGYEAVADWLFEGSGFTSPEKFAEATRDSASLHAALRTEPLQKLRAEVTHAMALRKTRYPAQLSQLPEITRWYTPYMRALMEFEPTRTFSPDANLTLRITYGTVAGYRYEDAVWHEPVTTLDGIMAKDNPAIYDYNIPDRLREVYAEGDFGRWTTTVDGRTTVPVCFIATNHTSGGNSGSPILNARGELVGLNFDRTWLSTMSDIEFDPAVCRNISVDIRYVLFVIEKIGGAHWLTEEIQD